MQLADGSHMMVSVVGEDGEGNVVVSFDGGETQVSMRREDVQGMVDAARAQRWELMLDNDEGEKVNSTGEAVSPVEGEGVPSAPNAASHKFELNDVVEVRGENGKMVQGYVTRPMNEDGLYEVFTDSSVGGLRSAYYAPEDMRLVEAKGVERLREGAQEDEDGALQGDEGRDERPSLMDAVRTLYKKGKDAAKQFARTFFDVARTPDFMKGVGLTGDRFTVRYGVLARHFGKDSAHDLPMEVWEQLPDALQKPFAISEYYTDEDKQQQKGYRIYTRLQLADGSHVMVSAEVKNAGRDVEVNAINTVFGRSVISDVHEKLVYVGNELTPEQQALLNGTTPHQYPDARGQDEEGVPSSEGKDSVSSDNGQGNAGENVTEMPMRRVKRKIEGQVMEVDEEDFEAVSPERTQDYLYNEVESGITKEQADDFVSAKIAEREKVVKGIEARKPRKGASPAEIRVHKGKVAAELAEALPGLEYWRAVAAARDAVKEREIAAVNERYRQERAAKEEAKRAAEVQRKEENGVGAAVRERWLNAPKVEGNADELTLANGEHVGGRYVLVESGAVSASHQAANGFARTEGFPMDENGGTVNDRDYERDGDAQRVTREIAQDYDARALQSPVVVSGDGVVLSGNGRTMAGELAALGGTDGAYVEHLKRYGVKYGFSREQVEKMKHPRVVFVVEEGLPYTAETFAKFNARETKAQSKTEEAVKMGKVVDDGTFGRVLRVLGGFETLGEFYGDEGAVREVVGELANAGVVGRMDMGGLFDGEGVSVQGRELIENVLVGKAFEGDGDAVRRLTEMKSMRTSVVNALGEVLRNKSLGGAFDFMEELPKAVALVYEARKTGGYKVGDAVDGFALQYDMFGEGQTVADPTDVAVLLLANAINDKRNTRLKGVLASYNDLAEDAAMGQGDIFSGFAQNKQSILEDVMRILQLSTPLTTNEHELSQLRDGEREQETQETQETDARAAEAGVGEAGASDEGLEDEPGGIGKASLSAKIAAAEGEVDAALKKELQDFIAQTDTMGRTAMDESGYDAEELFAPLLLDGKPSPLAVMTSVSDNINDPSVQIAVYDYSQEIDEKTNSGWQKWGNLADEYNAQAAEEDKGWERGDTALLGFRSVDAAVRFYDWVQHRDGVQAAKQLATDVVLSLLESADVPVEVVSDEVAAAVLPEHAQLHMVYHGSGAKFDKFDHSHMGEGEGVQAYGWGSYVTEVEGIGRTYAKAMLADKYKENRIVNQLVRERLESDGSKEESLKYLKSLLEEGWSDKKRVRKQIKIIETGKYLPEGKVHLYTVEIPDDREKNYLHWDQSVAGKEKERIRIALTKAVIGRLEASSPSERQDLRTSISAEFRHDISTGQGVYSVASRYLSPMEASGLLSSLGYTGISYAAQATAGGRADGARNYVIFNEHDLKITNHVEFMKTSQGTVYGWTVDGKIYLTRAGLNPETPIHEYTHLWAGAMRERNAEGWKSIKDLLQGSPMWEEVMHDPNYSHIKGDEDAVASEVLSRISGKENAKRFEEEAKKVIDETRDLLEKARAVMLLNNVRRAVKQFWNWVGRHLFGIKRFASIDEVTDRVLYDLASKTNLKTGKGHDKSLIGVDNQGNLVDGEGHLVTEKVGSIDDLRDEDFTSPSRSVELPELDARVADAIGTGGKPVVIKKNIFERNAKAHGDLTAADSRDILKAALYTPTLYGRNQKTKRPYNWVLIKTRDAEGENRVVLLEVNKNKDNVEIVHWHYVRDNALETIKRQAVREGGPILILPSEDSEEAGGLSSRTNNLSSEGKVSESSKKEQEIVGKNGVIRLQKGDDVVVSAEDAALRDAVVELMRGAGIDVVVDSEEGQRVLDMENGGVRWAMERKTFRSGRSIVFTRANPTTTLNALERGLKKEGVEVESHKARTGSRYAEFERGGVWYKVRSANHTKALSVGTTLDEVRGMSGIELTMDLKDGERPVYGVEVDLSLNEMGVEDLRALMDEVERFNGSGVDVLSKERVAGFVLPSSYLGDEFPLLSGFLDDEVLRSDEFKGRVKEAQAEVGAVREAYEKETGKPVLDEWLHLPFTASNGLKIEHLADGFGRYVSLMPVGSALSHGIGRFGDAKKLRKEAFAEYQAAVAPYEARLMAWEESAPSLEEWLKGNEEMSRRWASAQEVLSRADGGARLHKVGAEEDAEEVNARFNDELSGLTEANADKVVLSLGRPSGILLSAGVEDRPMKLYGNKVMKKMRKHGFALEELRDLPRAVADPVAVFAGSHDGSHAILTELRMGEKNVLVSLSVGKGGADIDFNIISSVYGKHQDGVVGWLNKGLARYVDKEKALDYLHHAAPIAVTSDNQELSSAAKVVKDFENPKLRVKKRRFFRTEDGKAYGFTVDGKVYLDPKMAGMETAVHEYTHLWADALRRVNPDEWRNVVELMKGTSGWDEVKRGYPELESEDEIADEVLAHYSGRRGAERLRAALDEEMGKADGVFERAQVVSAFERVKRALARFWKGVADFVGVHFGSADEVADMVLGDLLRGRRLDGEGVSKRERGDARYSGAVNVKNLEEKMEVFGWKPREAKTEGMTDLYDVRPVVSTKDYYLGTRADFEMVATDKPAERMYDESEKALSVGDIEAVWEELKGMEGFRLERSPKSDSEYLVNDGTGEIYRKSDHWGRVASCHWMLNGRRREGGDWYIGRANVDEFEREKGGYMYSTEESRRERFLLVQAAAENLERALGDGAFKFTAAARREAEKKLAGYRRVLGDVSVEDIVGDVEYGRDMYGRYYAKKSLMGGRFHREVEPEGDVFSVAERVAAEEKREGRAQRNARYHREGGSVEYGQAVSRAAYEQRMASGAFQSREALQDSMLSLREAMDLILHKGEKGKGWRVEEVSDLENAYMGENRLSSVNSAEQEAFTREVFKPMLGAVAKLAETEEERMVLTDYLMAKHGLERNRVMAEREGLKAYETYVKKHPESGREVEEFIAKAQERDYAGLTALTGVEEVSGAEMEAAKMVEEFEEKG